MLFANNRLLLKVMSLLLVVALLLVGCSEEQHDEDDVLPEIKKDIENFSDDYEGAVRYRVTANFLDLEAVDSYPQKIERIDAEDPYDIVLQVKNQSYHAIDSVPYKKYTYDEEIAQYLEETETIQVESGYVTDIAISFLTDDATIQGIVGKALLWNKNNLMFDTQLAKKIHLNTKYVRSAEETIQQKAGTPIEYANVFIALMRRLGIPARFVYGFYQAPHPVLHAWAEFYLKGYGWIPVESYFCRIGVSDSYIKLFVGKDMLELNLQPYKFNVSYEILDSTDDAD